jgi:hypothetical protein
MHFERPQRELVVRRDKNNSGHRHFGGVHRPDHPKPIQPGHLHIQKNHIRLVSLYRCDGRFSAVRFPHHLHAGFFTKKAQHFPARRRFVVHDENPEWLRRTHSEVCVG